jgi:hypothetical protein
MSEKVQKTRVKRGFFASETSSVVGGIFWTSGGNWGQHWGQHPRLQRELPPKMALTEMVIKNARPAGKAARLFDAGGLYLEVSPPAENGGA